MGKEHIQSKEKKSQKTKSLINKAKKRKQDEPDEIDSLVFLKDSNEKNKGDDFDERIKLLRSELQSLLTNIKSKSSSEKCLSSLNNDKKGCDLLEERENQNSLLILSPRTESNADLKPSTSKCSDLFDKFPEEKPISLTEDSVCDLNLPSEKTIVLEDSVLSESCFKSTSSLPENEVERLLYKAFYLQNFNVYLSSSEENPAEEVQVVKKKKQTKLRRSKSIKKEERRQSKEERLFQKKINKYFNSYRNCKRRRRIIIDNPWETTVEVDSFADSVQDAELVDLDVTDYDWSEPFTLDDEMESEVVEILDTPEKVNSNPQKESNNAKETENQPTALDDSCGNVRSKSRWECPICFEPSKGQEVVATHCGHIFCKKCLNTHFSKFSKKCPACRTDLSKKSPINLFNF